MRRKLEAGGEEASPHFGRYGGDEAGWICYICMYNIPILVHRGGEGGGV